MVVKVLYENIFFTVGQLLFFTQPNGQGVWNQKIINEGEADGNFKTIQHYKRNYIVVAANQFSSLSVFWTTGEIVFTFFLKIHVLLVRMAAIYLELLHCISS